MIWKNMLVLVNQPFFADDTNIYLSGKDIGTLESYIKGTMNQLHNWFEDNKLIINKGKTIAMSFHHVQNKYPEKPVIKYESTIIPYSSSVKFLGVWMDENLKWSVHLHNSEMKLS